MSEKVVYTAIADRYDDLKPLPSRVRSSVICIAFLDDATRDRISDPGGWIIKSLVAPDPTPLYRAKRFKVLADQVLPPGTEESLWVDGSIRISEELDIVREFEDCLSFHDLALFRHPRRECIYDEADVCVRLGLDEPSVIARQIAGYRRAGYPESNGLAMAGIIFRRHSPRIGEFNAMWWSEIMEGSSRDQLSLDPVSWRMGLQYNHLSSDRVGYESRDPGGNGFLVRPCGRIGFSQSGHVRGRGMGARTVRSG